MWALKHATETTAVVWVRHTANGVLSCECNGQTFTGDAIDTAVDDGIGIVTVTGLHAGQSYPFTAYVDGDEVASGTLRTMPAAGSRYQILVHSCHGFKRDAAPMESAFDALPNIVATISVGDLPYICEPTSYQATPWGSSWTLNGETIVATESLAVLLGGNLDGSEEAAVKAEIWNHYRAYWKMPSVYAAMQRVPFYMVDNDDHGRPGNDWCGAASAQWDGGANTAAILAFANYWCRIADAGGTTKDWCATQADFDYMEQWCCEADAAYFKGMPCTLNATDPRNMAFDVGDATWIFLDGIKDRQLPSTSANMISAATEAWLENVLATSTRTWKIVMCGKAMYGLQDDFGDYPDNEARVSAIIDGYASWDVPGGLVWMTGDTHIPHAIYNESHPFLEVCGCPTGTYPKTNVPNGYQGGAGAPSHTPIYKSLGYASNSITQAQADLRGYLNVGFVDVNGAEWLEAGIIDDTGNIRFRRRVLPGSNVVVDVNGRFG